MGGSRRRLGGLGGSRRRLGGLGGSRRRLGGLGGSRLPGRVWEPGRVCVGVEKLKIRTARGQAKVAGTLFCIGGSLVFTFWKGGYLFKGFVKKPLINISVGEMRRVKENWIKGAVLILTSHFAWSAWLKLQAVVSKVYTARLSLTTMTCLFRRCNLLLALFFARNPISWRLEWNLQLLTIVYCGVVISALAYYLQTWCISYKGRVFAAMFSPLQIIIVALFSAIAFAERLHFGSLIGVFLIIVGLYCVLWGKRKDNLVAEQTENGKGVLEDIKVLEHDISAINPVTRERTLS
ncbi:unnamed protein product [Prunus armeniaca]